METNDSMDIKKLKIEVFYSKEGLSDWKLLPETSRYLTERQLVPSTGDGLTFSGEDGKILGLEPTDFQHIQTVRRRWLNYASADVAILVHYEAW